MVRSACACQLDLEHVRKEVRLKIGSSYLVLSAIAFTLIACKGVTGCDICRTTAVANVSVRDSADQPMAGVDIVVGAYEQSCGSQFLGGEGPLRADGTGYRSILMSSLYSPHSAGCLRVIISPGTNLSQPNDTADFITNVEFRVEDSSPRDSVRLDVVIPVH